MFESGKLSIININKLSVPLLYLFINFLKISESIHDEIAEASKLTNKDPVQRSLVFVEGQENLIIKCPFYGHHSTNFSWKKNGLDIGLGVDNRINTDRNDGRLELKQPIFGDQGIYWCTATNHYGRATMPEVDITSAVLHRFLTSNTSQPTFHDVTIDQPFRMTCQAPLSHPPAGTYWAVFNPNTNRLRNLNLSERVQTDFDGGLYFSSIESSDDLGGGDSYVCVASNKVLGKFVQGDYRKFIVHKLIDAPKCLPPSFLWSTPKSDVALFGTRKRLKCIFSGKPTPSVTWSREDGKHLNLGHGRFSLVEGTGGAELLISNVTLEDEGTFTCTAWNQAMVQNQYGGCFDRVKVHLSLKIETTPRWHANRPPPSLVQGEDGGEIVIESNVIGRPQPDLVWLSNGVPFPAEVMSDKRMSLRNGRFQLKNVTSRDKQIVQLRASNAHGMLVANIAIEIRASPPLFEEHFPHQVEAQMGSTVQLSCRVKGHPTPQITWTKVSGNDVIEAKNRAATEVTWPRNGDVVLNGSVLILKNVTMATGGQYRCRAENKFGHVIGETDVYVRESPEVFGIFTFGYTWLIILPVLISLLVGMIMIILLITCRKRKSKREIYKVFDRELLYATANQDGEQMDEIKMQTIQLATIQHPLPSNPSSSNMRHTTDFQSDNISLAEKKSSSTASTKSLPRPLFHLGSLAESVQPTRVVMAIPRDFHEMENTSPCESFTSGSTVIHNNDNHHQQQQQRYGSNDVFTSERTSPPDGYIYATAGRLTPYETSKYLALDPKQFRNRNNQINESTTNNVIRPCSPTHYHHHHDGVMSPHYPPCEGVHHHPDHAKKDISLDQPSSATLLRQKSLVVEPDLCLSVSTIV